LSLAPIVLALLAITQVQYTKSFKNKEEVKTLIN